MKNEKNKILPIQKPYDFTRVKGNCVSKAVKIGHFKGFQMKKMLLKV